LVVTRGGDFDYWFFSVIELSAQRARHNPVHVVEGGYVGEFKDLFVGKFGPQSIENSIGHSTTVVDQSVGVGEHRAFDGRETLGHRPTWDGGDLLFTNPGRAARFAVLGKNKLTGAGPAHTRLAEFAQLGVKQAVWTLVKREAPNRVGKNVGHESEDRPPITGGAGGGARSFYWATVGSEHEVVEGERDGVGLVASDLAESGH
jgi:hypothetical protein